MADDGVVRLGIVGFGRQGSTYAGLIASGATSGLDLAAVCDIDLDRLEAAARDYPGAARFIDMSAMFSSGAVDAVVITLPHYLHAEAGIAAFDAGLHVLVDKPVGVSAGQARSLIERGARSPELTFAIMYNQRTNPVFRRVREVVRGGEIGEVRRATWIVTNWWRPQSYYDHDAWRGSWGGEGGGVLVNQAVHQLDLWQWICGMPVRVQARLGLGVSRDITVETEVSVLAEYANGGSGEFLTATNDVVGTDRLEIVGTAGRIVVTDSVRAEILRLAVPEPQITPADLGPTPEIGAGASLPDSLASTEVVQIGAVRAEQHAGVLTNFADAILNGAQVVAPGAEGLDEVRLANAIYLAGWTGEAVPVDAPEATYLAALNAKIRAEGRFAEREV